MSNVSKLVIKACSDNKFSSFTGEFITSINPEDLVIKSDVSYHVPEGMASAHLLKYCGSPPRLLSFSLLFDNTGIMPGSNAIAVMDQVKQLQDVAYHVHKKHNAPNYIRVIWGQLDFKGRLQNLDIVYSMFQVDGTLVRAEARMSVLEEIVPVGKGKSAAGVDTNYQKASGPSATVGRKAPLQTGSSDAAFAPTPNGVNGAYSGAPEGAYSGGPDDIYHGANASATGQVHGDSLGHTGKPGSTIDKGSSNNYGSSVAGGSASDHSATSNVDGPGNGFKGGVAGNGPGGSGGGIGGGGHGPAIDTATSPGGGSSSAISRPSSRAASGSHSPLAAGGAGGSLKSNMANRLDDTSTKSWIAKVGSGLAAGAALTAAAPNSLRKLSKLRANVSSVKNNISFFRRLKNFVKKVAPRAYDAGKKVVKSSGF